MTVTLDETHDPKRTSWVASANQAGTAFPLQNLPLGVYLARKPGAVPKVGTAIGDQVLDIAAAGAAGLLTGAHTEVAACGGTTLNALMALAPANWKTLRKALSQLLGEDGPELNERRNKATPLLTPLSQVDMLVPAEIGDFSDFFASVFHATNTGSMFRPDNPLLPNYKHVPIAYHGRASSIFPSGTPVVRPNGQALDQTTKLPRFGPCRQLDYEGEFGIWLGTGNESGKPLGMTEAADRLFGICLLNDWSARDIQAWEYQPLGPFLAKSFATTISPWIVTMEALAPFRVPAFARPDGDPAPLPYLVSAGDAATGGLSVKLDILMSSGRMRATEQAPFLVSSSDFADSYWTAAQMVAHHASNGCNLRPGDLFGTGTMSGPDKSSWASLLEMTWRGTKPISLPDGETRGFLEDGDEVIFRGSCSREGFVTIGLGEARAVIQSAP